MCLGVPVTVVERSERGVLCRDADGGVRRVDVQLLDAPPEVGDALLVHVDVALRPLDAAEARAIADALAAVEAAAAGRPYEHLIADLVDREPELPAHLRGEHAAKHTGGNADGQRGR